MMWCKSLLVLNPYEALWPEQPKEDEHETV